MTQVIKYSSKPESTSMDGSYSKMSKPEANTQFEIHTLEWMQQHRTVQLEKATRISGFEIIWVRKGSGFILVDCNEYRMEDNVIYCFSPGQLRQFQTDCRLEGYYISLSAEFLYMAESQIDFPGMAMPYNYGSYLQRIQPDQEMQHELEETIVRMRKEFTNYFLLRSEILKGLLRIFMIYLSRKVEDRVNENIQDKDTQIARKFMTLLKKHFTTKRMVADYARELCVTPNYLNRIVKKVSGYPASHHIQQYIILEAKRQAMYSGLSMKEVAYGLGFNDYAHFSKFFKNNSGMNFKTFKNGIH